MTSEAASQTSPKGFSLADIFKPFKLPISKVSSSDVLKALGKFLPVIYQKGITSNQTLNCPACPEAPYHIGDFAQGGVVIWLTNDGLHGLVAAIKDVEVGSTTTFRWSMQNDTTNATNNNPLPFSTPNVPYRNYYGGYLNQDAIQKIVDWENDYPAFKAAANYTKTVNGVTYDDWWLPSSRELSLMFAAVGVINQVSQANGGNPMRDNPSNASYFSSYQNDPDSAWYLAFDTGSQSGLPKNVPCYLRCVRAF